MKQIYHYSETLYHTLLTRRRQGFKETNNIPEINGRSYLDHISFFIEPIPLDILPSLHHNKHPFYQNNKSIYEYVISTEELSGCFYHLTESPEKTKLLYDKTITDEQYYEKIERVNEKLNYTGTDIVKLEKLIEKFTGTTRAYFINVPKLPNYEELKTKYAPTVPHLMIYPKNGEIKYNNVSFKTMGNKNTMSEKIKTESFKISYANW
jgi:hypothetical protein